MREHHYLPKPTFPHFACYPESLGHYGKAPVHSEKRRAGELAQYNLHIVVEGEGVVYDSARGRNVDLTRGGGFLYGPGTAQEYGANPKTGWVVRWIHFDVSEWFPMLDFLNDRGLWVFACESVETIAAIHERMTSCCESFKTALEPTMSALLYECLAELCQNAESEAGLAPPGQRASIRDAADLIRSRCEEAWTLAKMARLSGYSEFHFSRSFHRVIGAPPSQYLLECRLLKAKRLLASTSEPVKRVALESGFGQPGYFIRMFKRATGMTPAEYRRASNVDYLS